MKDPAEYWDRVAWQKTFTHPLNIDFLKPYVGTENRIIDYGCGYGRLVAELDALGFSNVAGFDISGSLIERGQQGGCQNLYHIHDSLSLPVSDASVDCFLLFAVLTCVPANDDQQALIDLMWQKLKPGGIIYLSDYYLQQDVSEVGQYEYLNNDPANYGVFSLPEGVTFRHHTQSWIASLTKAFTIKKEEEIAVTTMNGHTASAFQMILRK